MEPRGLWDDAPPPPEPEEVDLDQPEIGAVVLVPLDHRPVLHRRRLQRYHLVEPPLGDDHAARMLAEMAGEVVDLQPQALEVLEPIRRGVEADGGQLVVEISRSFLDLHRHVAAETLGDAVDLFEQLLTVEHAARILQEETDQAILDRRQLELGVVTLPVRDRSAPRRAAAATTGFAEATDEKLAVIREHAGERFDELEPSHTVIAR